MTHLSRSYHALSKILCPRENDLLLSWYNSSKHMLVFESSLPRDHPLEGNMPVFESPLHRDPQLEGSMLNVMYNRWRILTKNVRGAK